MKSSLFSMALIFSMLFAMQQSDSWKIYHNDQLILRANEEGEKNMKVIKRSELDRIGNFVVSYEEADPNSEWKRTIAIVDEKNNNLFEKNEINKIQLTNKELKALTKGIFTIKIYTWALPKDPAKAALIRIRRVHLCTLELK